MSKFKLKIPCLGKYRCFTATTEEKCAAAKYKVFMKGLQQIRLARNVLAGIGKKTLMKTTLI